MTSSRLTFLSILLVALSGAGCTTSGIQAADVLTLAPAPASSSASGQPPESGPVAAQAQAAVAAVSEEEDSATEVAAYVGATPSAPVAEVAFAPKTATGAAERAGLDRMIDHYAKQYDVPVDLVHRVVRRESNYRPEAYHAGNWGLMQIRHATARGMGYQGDAKGLLDAETNLRYAVRYLRGAWLVAGRDQDRAIRLYARGYYYDAKRAGLLDETGLGRDRVQRRKAG